MNANLKRKYWKAGLFSKIASQEEVQTLPETNKEVEVKVETQLVVDEELVEVQPVVEETVVAPKSKKVKKVVESE